MRIIVYETTLSFFRTGPKLDVPVALRLNPALREGKKILRFYELPLDGATQ